MAPFKSSAGRTLGKLVKTFATNNIGDGIARVASVKATGGTKIERDEYTLHVYTAPGTFTVKTTSLTAANVLVIGGGGAGSEPYSTYAGGGGGAGGFLNKTDFIFTEGSYAVTVGDGGTAGDHPHPVAAQGSPSVISTLTAYGGGGAGLSSRNGGSGAGGGANPTAAGGSGNKQTGTVDDIPAPLQPQGNDGSPNNGSGQGGGGGGAGAAGSIDVPTGGVGGDGLPITWVPGDYGTDGPSPGRWFAGGGGGGGQNPAATRPGGNGGAGGGGNGGSNPGASQTAGQANTGGGGGAGTYVGTLPGSDGGSGIVIVRYLTR